MRTPRFITYMTQWFDAKQYDLEKQASDDTIDLLRITPFIFLHLACLAVFWVGISTTAVLTAVAFYALRVFALTGFYHRYFSHRAFKTSRAAQFIFAVLGSTAVQRGPIWWAAHHRHHHRYSDEIEDVHSAKQHGFWWSHMGWFLTRKNFKTDHSRVPDLIAFPEILFLDRFDILVPVAFAVFIFLAGQWLAAYAPSLHTNGWQMLVWGFFISTVLVMQATFSINSLTHCFGFKRYKTKDESRNNFWLALLTFGEGWHNNHHHYPGSANQGFYWWEVDITYYILRLLQALGIIWDLRGVPEDIRLSHEKTASKY